MTNKKKANYLIDPVCKKKIAKENIDFTFNYCDNTYHFCTKECLSEFASNPKKYFVNKSIKRKGLWKRYLDRLNKTTEGRPPCCH